MDIRSALKDLKDAVDRGRYGDFGRKKGDRESYGRALLKIKDFCRCPSGLLDDAEVRFSRGDLPKTPSDLAIQFEWMMHAPRNAEVIEALTNALRPLWERNPHRTGRKNPIKYAAILAKPNPVRTANAISEIRPKHPKLANFIMQGYLDKAQSYIANQLPAERPPLRDAYGGAAIFWIFFKAQIKAARLFHAEWNCFETGAPDAPVRLTIGDASVPLGEAQAIARIATKMVGGEPVTAEEEARFRAFVTENDLAKLGLDQAEALGFSRAQADSSEPAPMEQLARLHEYLSELDELVADFVDSFVNSKKTKPPTILDLVYTATPGNRREKYAPKPGTPAEQIAAIRAAGRREADMVAATARYGMSTLTCLAYAILDMYAAIIALTRPYLVQIWGAGDDDRAENLLRTAQREKSDALYNLLLVYRCVITRDRYSESSGIEADTTGFDEGDYLTHDESRDYKGAGYFIEDRPPVSDDGFDRIMGRGVSVVERIGDISFDLGPRGDSVSLRGIADKSVAEARTIRKFEAKGSSRTDHAIAKSVGRFRKEFGS
jgi:hypothetical protein